MLLKQKKKGRSETICGFRTKRSTSLPPGVTKFYKKTSRHGGTVEVLRLPGDSKG
jgi:hypothetical protein